MLSKPIRILKRPILGTTAVLVTNLACRPVITIGWGEMLLLVLLGGILIGPILARFLRRVRREDKDSWEKKD